MIQKFMCGNGMSQKEVKELKEWQRKNGLKPFRSTRAAYKKLNAHTFALWSYQTLIAIIEYLPVSMCIDHPLIYVSPYIWCDAFNTSRTSKSHLRNFVRDESLFQPVEYLRNFSISKYDMPDGDGVIKSYDSYDIVAVSWNRLDAIANALKRGVNA